MIRTIPILLAVLGLAFLVGCAGPVSNVAPPGGGLHAPEGVLAGGGQEPSDQQAVNPEDEDAGLPAKPEEETDAEEEAVSAVDCTSAPMHTIEVAAKTTIKKGKQTTIPISVKEGSGSFRWYSISFSTLPAGMYFQEGPGGRTASILGAPLKPGTYQPVIRVRDEACDRNAEKQISIEVTPEPVSADQKPNPVAAMATKPVVRLVLNSSTPNPRDVFLFDDHAQEEPHFISQAMIVAQPLGRSGNDFPIPEGRYTITYRYYHTFQRSDGTAGSQGCDAAYAASHPACYKTLENGVHDFLNGSPGIDENTEYEFVVVDTQAENATYKYLLYATKSCRTLNLNDAYILIKVAYAKTYEKGWCYSGGDYHVTWAGVGLSNARWPVTTTDSKNHWMRGGIYRSKYKLTSDDKENNVKDQPKEIVWGPDDRRVKPPTGAAPRCLEEIDHFGLWFKEGGCAGSKPDFRVEAIEVKACPVEERLKQQNTKDCWFASYYKEGDYVGWNNVGNYGERKGNFYLDFIPETNNESWTGERNMQVIDVFHGLDVDY